MEWPRQVLAGSKQGFWSTPPLSCCHHGSTLHALCALLCATPTQRPPPCRRPAALPHLPPTDCNSVVIGNVLLGAKVNNCVREVVTNLSCFQRVEAEPAACGALGALGGSPPASPTKAAAPSAGGWLARAFGGGGGGGRPKPASQRLVISPRHPHHEAGSHGCPLCPENL